MGNAFSCVACMSKPMTVKAKQGAIFGWNQTQQQAVTATWTVKKKCQVLAFSLIDSGSHGDLQNVSGYVRLNGTEAPGRITSAWYKASGAYMFQAQPGDVVTAFSQAKTTTGYGAVNACILTDE